MTRQQIQSTLKKNRQLLPLLVLTAYSIHAIIEAIFGAIVRDDETYGFILVIKHYLGFGVLALNFITYFLFREYYRYTLTLTIAIGLFNLITFSAFQTRLSFYVNDFEIGFQLSAFFAGLLAYIINFQRVNEFILDNLGTKKTPEEEEIYQEAKFEEGTQKFKARYINYSTEKLDEIIAANKYVPEALEAARQILNERQPK